MSRPDALSTRTCPRCGQVWYAPLWLTVAVCEGCREEQNQPNRLTPKNAYAAQP